MPTDDWLLMLRIPADWRPAIEAAAGDDDPAAWAKRVIASKLKQRGSKISVPRGRGRPKKAPAQ
jgi:hypothetical protein